ncbi:hypothetical protein HPB50_014939 [Hyalomma asiaticum]|uniref:Uncharacterized protein n=1 Tax=Hyalomma asiaticum TaxID=266040 RepID=A0ACB7SLX0_HYAAI|nr:hypothetical protein HPB50_014939 [Hyalomma asiaticum]
MQYKQRNKRSPHALSSPNAQFISSLVLLVWWLHSPEQCRAECTAEYQKLSKDGVTHTACKSPNPRCHIIGRGLRDGEAEEILRLHNAYRSQMALGLVPGFKPAANMQQLKTVVKMW